MVSVRCMRGWLPGGKSMTAKRVPFAGGAVPMMRAPKSSICSPTAMSAGVRSVDQISVETVPGLGYLALVAGPCMTTLATLLASWPVTKRRMGGYCSVTWSSSRAVHTYSIVYCEFDRALGGGLGLAPLPLGGGFGGGAPTADHRTPPPPALRHSRCFTSAFLKLRTAAEGRLCPRHKGEGMTEPAALTWPRFPFRCSIKLYPHRLVQCAPVRQIVLDELGKLRGREIDAFEAVHAEELARLRQFQNLGDVGVNLRHQIRGHIRRPEQREPGGGRETRHAGLGDRR